MAGTAAQHTLWGVAYARAGVDLCAVAVAVAPPSRAGRSCWVHRWPAVGSTPWWWRAAATCSASARTGRGSWGWRRCVQCYPPGLAHAALSPLATPSMNRAGWPRTARSPVTVCGGGLTAYRLRAPRSPRGRGIARGGRCAARPRRSCCPHSACRSGSPPPPRAATSTRRCSRPGETSSPSGATARCGCGGRQWDHKHAES
eukprot:COSAG01_NODE_2670_length_7274_cov_4.395540_5_plen_201_part_00